MAPAPSSPIEHSSINDLIGKPPSWILRSGISLIAISASLVLTLSQLIVYPDKVSAEGMMTAGDPPILHHGMVSGILDTLFVADGAQVPKNAAIAYFQNTAVKENVAELKTALTVIDSVVTMGTCQTNLLPDHWVLGNLQADYARMQLIYQEYCQILAQEITSMQVKAIEQELIHLQQLHIVYNKDRELQKQELELAIIDHERQYNLWRDQVISTLDYERSKSALLQSEKIYNNTNQSLIQNGLRSDQLRQDIIRIREERNQQLLTSKQRMREQILHMNGLITQWKQQHFVYAQADGLLNWYPEVSKGKYLQSGEPVFTIIQSHREEKFVRIYLPSIQMTRIEIGTRAILKLDAYPYKQWGIIESTVSYISAVPNRDKENTMQYELHISLPDNLKTTYGLDIVYKAQGGVQAALITEDRSILTRIFDQFLNLIKNTGL